MKKSIQILTGALFTLTLIFYSCTNKPAEEEGSKKTETKECTLVMEMKLSDGAEVAEYDQDIHGYISLGNTTSMMNMKISFEGNVLSDTTETENSSDIDTVFIGEVNEEGIELIILLRDSMSLSGIMGSIDSMRSNHSYTEGSYKDLMDGKEITITETNESFENNKKIASTYFARMGRSGFPSGMIDGEVSVNILSADIPTYRISQTTLECLPMKIDMILEIPIVEEACLEMRKNLK